MENDWVIALTGVVVGLLGGAGIDAYRQHRARKSYRKAIYEELRDVHSAVLTRRAAAEEILKEFIETQIVTTTLAGFDYPIFKKWYAEVVLMFTEDERLALTSIYNGVDHLVWMIQTIRNSTDLHTGDQAKDTENLRVVVQMTEGAFAQAHELDAMIGLLLDQKKNFNIDSEATTKTIEAARAGADRAIAELSGRPPGN